MKRKATSMHDFYASSSVTPSPADVEPELAPANVTANPFPLIVVSTVPPPEAEPPNEESNGTTSDESTNRPRQRILGSHPNKIIKDDIGDKNFSILIDEARYCSVEEQMAVTVRFLDDHGVLQERFLAIKHITDCTSAGIKEALVDVLDYHGLQISRLRGQSYDGASNMRGEFNGLQKLVRDEAPYAFYVHCFAHQLQKDALLAKHQDELLDLMENGKISSGTWLDQESSITRQGDTRWGSHLRTLLRIFTMWNAVVDVLGIVVVDAREHTCQGGASGLLIKMECFEFLFIMLFSINLLGTTNYLSQALQRKNQNTVEAMHLILDVKESLQDMRDNGWESLFSQAKNFCECQIWMILLELWVNLFALRIR
ncbi:zinc finger MYM-type protein 1-like isoform X2 [Triticum urartu]|uniref:zinc finger MYM-type protein 1-like isoform X2 n=1 Tax=Triticum urartu TaxID=4572 RepID=UPI00204367B4|nr:zinc finger MYM-type protein 1-like isoform X2 [Triticum urartu]